jgi:uncharacterized protein YajQ (UPF0234 family)
MPSFDITSEVNQMELKNAIDQANKEITNRFDFKGSDARVELSELTLTLHADDEFKLKQVMDLLVARCAKRNVDVRAFDPKAIEKASGNKVRQAINVRNGIEQDTSKRIVKLVKESKLKVQASIQGDKLRVTGKSRDDLQAAMALLRQADVDRPLQFNNFRD